MPVNKGLLREDEIIEFLNGKKVEDLSYNLQRMIEDLYGVVNPKETITCEYGVDFTKPDFVVSYKGRKKYVSMKSGEGGMLHLEKLETFIPFLRSNGISEETLRTILLFQYGDGTVNGTGKKRMSSHEAYNWLSERIKKANEELNSNQDFIKAFLERVIFQGVRDDVPGATHLYYGTYEEGYIVNKRQIINYVLNGNFDFFENLHVGPIFMRPHARYVGTNIKNDFQRHRIQLYWKTLPDDVNYIRRHYYDCNSIDRRKEYKSSIMKKTIDSITFKPF